MLLFSSQIRHSIQVKIIISIAVLFTAFFFTYTAYAATITVDSNTGDVTADGECNLAEAIDNANAGAQPNTDCIAGDVGADTIEFAIGVTNDTQVISGSNMGYLVTSEIHFDGLTQGDASCGVSDDLSDRDLDIEIDGPYLGFLAGADGSSMQGLSILSAAGQGVLTVNGVDGFTTTCSNLGIDATGTAGSVNNDALILINESSSNITIGGPTISDANLIGGSNASEGSASMLMYEVDDMTIQGNWFGRGVGPSFNEFPSDQGYIVLCGPTTCSQDTGPNSNITIDSNIVTTAHTGVNENGTAISIDGVAGFLNVTNNIVGNTTGNAIELSTSENVVVDSNIITDSGADGLNTESNDDLEITNNVISGSGTFALFSQFDNLLTIQGNKIGTDETGMIAIGSNGADLGAQAGGGMFIMAGTDVLIGGDGLSEGNVIAGNDSALFNAGIALYPDISDFTFAPNENVTIQGNYIGVAADGVTALSNNENSAGIYLGGVDEALVGGTNPTEYNTIQGGLIGMYLMSTPFVTILQDISILGNKMYNMSSLAVEFIADTDADFFPDVLVGPNPNDAGDTDEGPNVGVNTGNNLNHLLNYPEFTSIETPEGSSTTDIEYILDVPAGDYRIEFFQNSELEDYGPGETFLGFQNITHTGSGEETFTTTLDVTVGDYIAATTTERGQATFSTFGATSEFSASATIQAMAEEVTRRRSSSTPQSKAKAQEAFAEYYAEESPSNNSSPENILGSGTCPADLIVTNNMKQGDRDGQYSAYNNGNVTQVALLQQHINRILAAQYNQAAGPVDGIFGPLTHQGVERLQTALNEILQPNPLLTIDGIVGPFTKDAINNSCGELEE